MDLLALLVLNEANVYNINEPYNKVSVNQYVTKLLSPLPADVLKQQLTKKLIKLITNDDTLLVPIKDLPDNAPDWAKASAAAGDLKAFQPNDDVNDKLSHISHFIKAAHDDSGSDNNDIAAHAKKELSGLVKVETLTILYNKANEYFSRGSHSAVRQVDGMEHTATTGKFEWYALTTQEAMAREGKTLQNCIGRIYTYDRLKRDNAKIFVMRDRNNNSVVAMRVSYASDRPKIQEFKGKNNRPPVPQYMDGVVEFTRRSQFDPRPGSNDFNNAGFYVTDGGDVITMPEAMEQFTNQEKLGTTDSGKTVVKVTSADRELFKRMVKAYRSEDNYYAQAPSAHYQLRDGNNVLATASCVDRNKVNDIWRRDGDSMTNAKELLQFLTRSGEINSVSDTLAKTLPLVHSMRYDKQNGITQIVPANTETTDVGGTNADIFTYEGRDAKALGNAMLDWYRVNGHDCTPVSLRVIPIAQSVYQWSRACTTAYVTTQEGLTIPLGITPNGSIYKSHQFNDNSMKDNVIRDIAIRSANASQTDLPLEYCAHAGITKDGDEYVPFVPSPEPATQNMAKFDLSEMSEPTKFIATSMIMYARKNNNKWSYTQGTLNGYGKSKLAHFDQAAGSTYGSLYGNDKDSIDRWQALKQESFGGQSPDALYVPSTTQVIPFVVVAVNNQVVMIDALQAFHGQLSGNDRASCNRIVQYVNGLVDAGEVTLTKESTKGLTSMIKFDRSSGKLVSGVDKMAAKMEKSHDDYTMTMEDGHVVSRMLSKDFMKWQEELQQSSLTGCDFYELKAPSGERNAIFAVKPKSNMLYKIYTNATKQDDNEEAITKTNNERYAPELSKYINAFAKENGITKFPSTSAITEKSPVYKFLEALSGLSAPTKRGRLCRAAGIGTYFDLERWDDAHQSLYPDRLLMKLGLATGSYSKEDRSAYLGPTPAGKEAFRKIKSGEITSLYQLTDSIKGSVSKKEPPPPTPAPANNGERRERAPRPADGQSKASRALTRFRELAAANGAIPARGEFIRILQAEFDMTPAGASTYYHNLKVKYAQEQGQLGERFTFSEYLMVIAE